MNKVFLLVVRRTGNRHPHAFGHFTTRPFSLPPAGRALCVLCKMPKRVGGRGVFLYGRLPVLHQGVRTFGLLTEQIPECPQLCSYFPVQPFFLKLVGVGHVDDALLVTGTHGFDVVRLLAEPAQQCRQRAVCVLYYDLHAPLPDMDDREILYRVGFSGVFFPAFTE